MVKKIGIAILGLMGLSLVYLAIAGSTPHEIKTEIEIAAPPAKVWAILSDVEQWQEWSPVINNSSGSAELGSKVDITMMGKDEGTDGPMYSPEIIELDAPKRFRWRAHMGAGFIMTNDKVFELEATSTGTKLTHMETFSGMFAPLVCGQMDIGVPPILNAMNQALKEIAENR